MTEQAYMTRVTEQRAMSMSNLKFSTYHRGEVVHTESGEIAWSSDLYVSPKAARLQANKMRPRYDAHLRRTGNRFEVEQREKREEFKARKRAAVEKRKQVREKAPDLLAALQSLIDVFPYTPANSEERAVFIAAQRTIAGLEFPDIPTE